MTCLALCLPGLQPASRSAAAGGSARRCGAGFAPGGERRLAGGVLVRSAFAHRGTARLLVHRLKYGGHGAAAAVLADAMAGCVPEGAGALVPVPRARLRRWRYGVDPAVELARALGRVLGSAGGAGAGAGVVAPPPGRCRRGPARPASLPAGPGGPGRGRSWWTTW